MRVLITTDSVGGVWQYSLALARGLVEMCRCRVLLVCFGEPDRADLEDAIPAPGVDLIPLKLKLEWMPGGEEDVGLARCEVERIARDWRAQVVHTNQYCFGNLDTTAPTIVVAHSDVLGWVAWHRQAGVLDADAIEQDAGLRCYRDTVAAGLAGANAVVCPSRFMATHIDEAYGCPAEVIYNGLWPDMYRPEAKQPIALVAGRLWDESKMAATAVEAATGLDLEVRLIGPTEGPTGERANLPSAPNASYTGRRGWKEVREALAAAQFYLATSSYEPFGLSALEAALSGCAVVANDIPSFREIWNDAAAFYRRNDPGALRTKLSDLMRKPAEVDRLGCAARSRALARYSARRMVAKYYNLYQSV